MLKEIKEITINIPVSEINSTVEVFRVLDFESIEAHLYALIVDRKVTINNLLSQSKDIQRDKLWNVFNYLQAEKKVIVNKDGYLERI